MSTIEQTEQTDQAPQAEQLTAWGARLDQAIADIQRLEPESRAAAEEFALAMDSLSREALTTMVKKLKADPRGKELLFELVDEPDVRFLLGLHGIIRMPDPEMAERVAQGIGEDGSVAQHSHGASAESKAFFSLSSLLRGPQSAHACGCSGGDACVCGDH